MFTSWDLTVSYCSRICINAIRRATDVDVGKLIDPALEFGKGEQQQRYVSRRREMLNRREKKETNNADIFGIHDFRFLSPLHISVPEAGRHTVTFIVHQVGVRVLERRKSILRAKRQVLRKTKNRDKKLSCLFTFIKILFAPRKRKRFTPSWLCDPFSNL